MSFNLTENHSRVLAYSALGILAILMFVWMWQQIAATAAYKKAMLAIAGAAKNGENLTLQVANFTPTNGKPDPDTDKSK